MPKKVHYQPPTSNYDACGLARDYALLTTDINQVTCQSCLNTVTGKKAGRPPKHKTKVHKTAFALSPKAFEKIQFVKNKSEFVSNLIENS